MEPDVLFVTPLAIDECIHREFPEVKVQIDEERKVVDLIFPQTFELPSGSKVTISTEVSRKVLIDSIKAVAQHRIFPDEATEAVKSCFALSEWAEGRRIQEYRSTRKEFEQHRSCAEAIIAYVKNPADQAALSAVQSLGLAPEQVRPQAEEDLQYFRGIKDWKLSFAHKQLFATRYEHVYRVLSEQSLQRKLAMISEEEKYAPTSITDSLARKLHQRVVGQDMAVEAMASMLLQKQGEDNKTFLFVGPTGVGKTELAEAVGQIKGNGCLVKFDMASYHSEHQVTSFTGSSTGFLGSDDLPDFCKKINATKRVETISKTREEEHLLVRNIVILFDDIGKAHTTVRSALLSLFDKGTHSVHYTLRGAAFSQSMNITVTYTFENCLFIGTSNLFQDLILAASQQQKKMEDIVELFTKASAQAASLGHPPYTGETPFTQKELGRMTVIPFAPIPKGRDGYQRIVDMKLEIWLANLNTLFQELFQKKCGRVVVDPANKQQLLELIEAGMYMDGTNIRKITTFLDKLQTQLLQTKQLTIAEDVEISIYAKGNGIFAQTYVVDDFFSLHEKIKDPIMLHTFEIGT